MDNSNAWATYLQASSRKRENSPCNLVDVFRKQRSAAALTVELMYEEKTRLTAAQVAWEYYDGTRWRALGADGPGDVLALKASGSIHFTVPQDIAEVSIDGDSRRWLRARLAGEA